MSDVLRAFFEDLAREVDRATRSAREAMLRNDGPAWAEDPRPFNVLREKLRSEDEIDAFASAARDFVYVALHSTLVAIDGGSASAEVGRVWLVDEGGRRLGEGLHESFFDYLFETGRMV
jgi:hypothetical protein